MMCCVFRLDSVITERSLGNKCRPGNKMKREKVHKAYKCMARFAKQKSNALEGVSFVAVGQSEYIRMISLR